MSTPLTPALLFKTLADETRWRICMLIAAEGELCVCELTAALDGSLNNATFRKDPNFGFEVPVSVPGVDDKLLDPRQTWADGAAYDLQAKKLVQMFSDNFAQYFDKVDDQVRLAAIG